MYLNRKKQLIESIPPYYEPIFHITLPSVFAFSLLILAILSIKELILVQLLTIPITILVLLFFEYWLHKKVMHRPTIFRFLYTKHSIHHFLYSNDEMEIESWQELHYVLMPAGAIFGAFSLALIPGALLTLLFSNNVAWIFITTAMLYFIFYEWLHLSYHLPKNNFISKLNFIKKLKKLHQTHHSFLNMSKYNFNVTIPLFDYLFKTKI